jgi:microcystin-dependent protein
MGLESTTFLDGLVSTNPVASDTVAQGDDHLRLLKAVIKASFPNVTYARYLEQPREDVADDGAPEIYVSTSNYCNLLGATTITGFDSGTSGQAKLCRVNEARTLTHHATTLDLPGGANIVAAAGDHFLVVNRGTTSNKVVWYTKANGKAVVETFTLPVADDVGKFLKATSAGVVAYVAETPIPTGYVFPWFTEDVPSGHLELNGAAVARDGANTALFALWGTRYGAGNGTTTFNLPDMRGEFLRGWDHGRGADPNAAARTDAGGGATGDHVGTKQADELELHGHPFRASTTTGGSNTNGGFMVDSDDDANYPEHTGTPSATMGEQIGGEGGSETRPRNIAVMWIVKL